MKNNRVKSWVDSNGNQCFCFFERKAFERPWIIIIVAILLSLITGVEYLIFGSYYSLTPCFILFFFAFLWWLTIPMKANEAIIENTVHEIMDGIVRNDAEKKGTGVVKSCVHYETKGTYAAITDRCFLVMLKSGEVWRYPISYYEPIDGKEGYYECKILYDVSENSAYPKAFRPRIWWRFVDKIQLSDNTRFWLLIIAIVITGGLAFWGCFWLFFKLRWRTVLLVLGYFVVYSISEWMNKKWDVQFVGVVKKIISAPLIVFSIVIGAIQPFITIVGTYFFVAVFIFGVPALVLKGMGYLGWWVLKPETILFIVLALGSVLCSYSYKLTKWIIHHSPLRDWKNHVHESYREGLAVYLIHPSNVIFLLYFVYFIFLSASGFMQIERGVFWVSESFDTAILKAFLVFIAFSNMRTRAKETEIEAKELLKRTLGLFALDDYKSE